MTFFPVLPDALHSQPDDRGPQRLHPSINKKVPTPLSCHISHLSSFQLIAFSIAAVSVTFHNPITRLQPSINDHEFVIAAAYSYRHPKVIKNKYKKNNRAPIFYFSAALCIKR